jgi:hypothetical protein
VQLVLYNAGGGSIGANSSPIAIELKIGLVYMRVATLDELTSAAMLSGGAATTYRVTRFAGFPDAVGVDAN